MKITRQPGVKLELQGRVKRPLQEGHRGPIPTQYFNTPFFAIPAFSNMSHSTVIARIFSMHYVESD